jgi:hypothetical protein
MTMTTRDLVGRVLKAIACTPNHGGDGERYQRDVVRPSRELRRRREEEAPAPLDATAARPLLEALLGALETKRVPATERAERLAEVLSGSGLEAAFPDLGARAGRDAG